MIISKGVPTTPTLAQLAKDVDGDGKVDIAIQATMFDVAMAVAFELEISEATASGGTFVVIDNKISAALKQAFRAKTTRWYKVRYRPIYEGGAVGTWSALSAELRPTKVRLDTSNLILNPSFDSSSATPEAVGWILGTSCVPIARTDASVPAGAPSKTVLSMTGTTAGTNRDNYWTDFTPVQPGEIYHVEGMVEASADVVNSVSIGMHFKDADETAAANTWTAGVTRTGAQGQALAVWTKISGLVTVPASTSGTVLPVALGRAWVTVPGIAGAAGKWFITNIRVRRATESEMIASGAITEAKLGSAAVTVTKIGADAVTPSKLAVGDTSNMVRDPNCVDLSCWTGSGVTISTTGSGSNGASSNQITSTTTTGVCGVHTLTDIPVEEGKQYLVSEKIAISDGVTSANMQLLVYWYSMNSVGGTTFLSTSTIFNGANAGYTKKSGIALAPANARRARIVCQKDATATALGITIMEPIFRRATENEMITDGAISSIKLASGAVTGDKLGIGVGANYIDNSDLKAGLLGWAYEWSNSFASFTLSLRTDTYAPDPGAIQIYQIDGTASLEYGIRQADSAGAAVYHSVAASKWYELSVYFYGHRCTGIQPYIQWLDGSNVHISYSTPGITEAAQNGNPLKLLSNYSRSYFKVQAPAGAAKALIFFRMKGTKQGFGYTDSYLWITRPFFAEANANQSEATPWSPSGGNIITASMTDQTAPGTPAAPTLASLTADIDGDGKIDTGLTATMALPGTGVAVKYFEVDIHQSAANSDASYTSRFRYTVPAEASGSTLYNFIAKSNRYYKARHRGVSFNGVKGTWSSLSTGVRPNGKTDAPGAVSGLAASALFKSVYLSWTPCADLDYDVTRLYRQDTVGGAVNLVAEVKANSFVDSNLTIDNAYYYWVGHVNTSGVCTLTTEPPTGGTHHATSTPGRITSGQIANGAVGTADVAGGAVTPAKLATASSFGVSRIHANDDTTAYDFSTNTTSCAYLHNSGIIRASRADGKAADFQRTGSDGQVIGFYRGATSVGYISVTTTGTSYNTGSDYRLKYDVEPLVTVTLTDPVEANWLPVALCRTLAARPVTFRWIGVDGPNSPLTYGFIAHELQAVFPEAVTGEKDAVEAIGTATIDDKLRTDITERDAIENGATDWQAKGERPVHQSVDHSKLVPSLMASVQELTMLVLELRREIEALKVA